MMDVITANFNANHYVSCVCLESVNSIDKIKQIMNIHIYIFLKEYLLDNIIMILHSTYIKIFVEINKYLDKKNVMMGMTNNMMDVINVNFLVR